MFWCDVCNCAYPHGQEGPSTALEAHTAAQHRNGFPSNGARPITGRQVVIVLLILAALTLVRHLFGFPPL